MEIDVFKRTMRALAILLAVTGAATCAKAQVVAFGASNVAGRGVTRPEAFPAQLENMLQAKGYNVHVVNAGVSGDGTQQMLARIDSALIVGTHVFILDVGGGLWNNSRLGVARVQGPRDIATMRARIRAIGAAVIDLHSNAGMPRKFVQPDGIHLTAEGHRLLAARLLPQVIRILGHR